MRHLLVILLLVTCLPGCTLLVPEKTPVGGSVWLVSQAEIHQAISVARAADVDLASAPISLVTVYNRTGLIIYFYRHGVYTYGYLIREGGQWRYIHLDIADTTVVT